MTSFCTNCNEETEHIVKQQGPHLGESCSKCNKWIRWVSQDKPYDPNFVIPFGKHKGVKISRLPTDYLTFMLDEDDDKYLNIHGNIRKWFEAALKQRFLDFIQEYMKIFVANWKGAAPNCDKMSALFEDQHPQVDNEKFKDYIARIIVECTNGNLDDVKMSVHKGVIEFQNY